MKGFKIGVVLIGLLVTALVADFRVGTSMQDEALATAWVNPSTAGNAYSCIESAPLQETISSRNTGLKSVEPSLNVFPAISNFAASIYAAMDENNS
jgi:hypothetical protein